MGRKYDFEYIIIGSGPAGTAAALTLSRSKKRIAIVERNFLGGSNINTRDVPYLASLDSSKLYHAIETSPIYQNQDLTFSFPNAVSHQLRSIMRVSEAHKASLESSKIVHLNGLAHFLDNHTIRLNGQDLTAEYFILASGSTLKTSEINGTDRVSYLTPDTAIKIRRSPKVALVVGGGPTGCEITEYFANLGIKVLLMETASRILPREDKEVSETISDHFIKDLGVMVLPNCKVVSLEQDQRSKKVIFQNARTEKLVRVDCIVLATGSEPYLDYGLENAGVKYKNTGIKVTKQFQTSTKNIYAIGDCIGEESSTERAEYEGTLLAMNLVNHAKNIANYHGFARVINTSPEVVTVGYNEDDLLKRDRKCKKAIVRISEIPAGAIYNQTFGFVKLIADKTNHIIGATIVAPNATDMAGELSLCIRHGVTALELASTPHATNSYSCLIKLAARKLVEKK
ncbi:NAD(P)/FAD-dependent oxidoreductase [Candidatus Saccharibacteria bacterium]|nr:NAD(P)/FAD-dependent oxidoreductase [Candidatus Saccharibacteria bacterium]